MKFTKAELEIIHAGLTHVLAMLHAVSILDADDEEVNREETKIIKSVLNKIAKEHTLRTVQHD